MTGITWDMFLRHSIDFINLSDKIGDNWCLEGNVNEIGMAYLKKSVINSSTNSTNHDENMVNDDVCSAPQGKMNSALKWEYHVFYSLSYNVPVLCFNVWKSNGSLLRLDDVWKQCQLRCSSPEELYSALTQQDHPILLKPFFTIHPCKTSEILNSDNSECNPIIRFISAIGPMVNLSLNTEYGLKAIY